MTAKRRILLVRHGETEWNSAFRFQGRIDVPLSDNGRAQASLLAERLANCCFDRVFSSPLSRACETARIVIKGHQGVELTTLGELSEMSFGEWESLTISEVREKDPGFFASWRENPSELTAPGGEPFEGLIARVGSAIEGILASGGETLLVVCHGGTIRAALSALIGVSPQAAWKFRVDNCSITAIDITEERTTLRYANDAVHLKMKPGEVRYVPVM